MTAIIRRTAYLLLLLVLGGGALSAQEVRLRGYGEADIDALLRGAIASQPLVITRDTLVRAGDTIRGNVLVAKRRFILEGTVLGDLTGVQANMYLRPGARVRGRVLNVAGGLYPSELAKMGHFEDHPLAPYSASISGAVVTVTGTRSLPAIKWIGGTQLPEYNRVDGLRVELGPRLELPPIASVEPVLRGSIGYATERKDLIWRAELGLLRGRSALRVGREDNITLTNEEWIRSQLKNSIAMIWNGKDNRNYYAADRWYAEFHRVIERGARETEWWLRGQREHAYPLAEGDPFVILKPDSFRFNPRVPESVVSSAIIGARSRWTGELAAFDLGLAFEFAGRALESDYTFNAFNSHVGWAMRALANHTLKIEANFRGPLPGTDALPLQRWTFVGGSGTLYTFDIGDFPGDRLAFVETEYRIPFARQLKAPIFGRPTLRLMHNIGMAWSKDSNPGFEQNIGARLQFPFVYARVVTNPRNFSEDAEFSVGISLAGKKYPWEKAR